MNSIDKIGKIEALGLLTTVIINYIIFNIPNIVLAHSGSGACLSIIYLTIICIIFVILICKFFKPFVGADLLEVSYFLGGKTLKLIIGILYIILFISFSSACVRYFTNSLHLIYFNDTPIIFLIIAILIPVAVCCKYGIKAISGTNLTFAIISAISVIILILAGSKNFVYQRLFPLFGYGAKELFINQFPNIFAFNVVAYLYFIRPFLKKESSFKSISILSIIICGAYMFFTIMTLLMTFPFIAQADETLSLYLLSRSVSFGKFLQRVDALFIFTWILSLLSFLSFNLFLITNIIGRITKIKYSSELTYGIIALVFSISLSFNNITSVKVFHRGIYKYYLIILVFVISFIILLSAYLKKKKQGVLK